MDNLGIAWLDANGRNIGSTDGVADLDLATDEAKRGFQFVYPSAALAVIYRGRTLSEGEVILDVPKSV